MRRVVFVMLLVLVCGNITAKTITKRDAQMAWKASRYDDETMRQLINVYTALQESGYRNFTYFFQFYTQYQARVDTGVIVLLDGQGVTGGFLDYLQALNNATGTNAYDSIYTLVFAWNQSVRVIELLEHIAFLDIYLLDEDIRAVARKNVDESKKILNSR